MHKKISLAGKFIICCICIVMVIMTGCAAKEDSNIDNDISYSMEEEALLNYDVPMSLPHILVNQLGYAADKSKQVFFYGETIPKTFKVIDAQTNETVYTGMIEPRGYSEEFMADVSVGDFTDFTRKGEYYVESDLLGSSYHFVIVDDPYNDIFKEAQRSYYYNRCGITLTDNLAKSNAHNACHTDKAYLRSDHTVSFDVSGGWHQDESGSKVVTDAADAIEILLLSYELQPESFSDDLKIPESGNDIPDILDEIKYEIDFLLKLQDIDSGAVYSGVTVVDSNNKTISYIEDSSIDASYAFAFSLAKFSYLYQRFDKEYATMCLQAADRAWQYANLNEKTYSEYKFPAASEIYRASDYEPCKEYLKEYFLDEKTTSISDMPELFGQLTYLSTTHEVDIDVCTRLMKNLMLKAEDISSKVRNSKFLVVSDYNQTNNSELLNDMVIMLVVDYIITNHEYDTIIANYLQYFMGCNPLSITYIDGIGTRNYMDIDENLGIMKKFNDNARLVFILSKISY